MSIQTVIKQIEADITGGLGHLEAEAAAGIAAVWDWSKGEVLHLLPTVEADVLDMAEKAVTMAESGEMGDILPTLIEIGETAGKDLLGQYGEGVLNVIAAIAKSKATPKPTA